MQSSEVDGFPSVFWSSLKATKPDWIRDKQVKFLVKYGSGETDPELQSVPFPDEKPLPDMASARLNLGQPFVMPLVFQPTVRKRCETRS